MKPPPGIKALWDRAARRHAQGRYAESLECMHALEAHLPDHPGLLANLGVVYRDSGDLDRSEQYLRRACAIQSDDPAAHFNLAVTLLGAGRLREGFQEYEWRWQLPQFAGQKREFAQPLWRGEPLEGRRILIWAEQGAGDAVQFVRYALLVRAAGGEVIIETLPHLERLFSWMEGGYRIVNALTAGVQFDVQCPMMSLPDRFATEMDSIPAPARFAVPAALSARWGERLRTARRGVGLVWSGNPKRYNNSARSVPAHCLQPLARLPGVQCWSLQAGQAASDAPSGIVSLAPELTDFGETAAVLLALDLVITVDTAVAHLAGSLGRPVWLLASYSPDWRWLRGRDDSPWYPSLRIFRQPRPGEWDEVIARVAAELAPEPRPDSEPE